MKYENLNAKYNISNFIFEIKYAIRGPYYDSSKLLTLSKGSKIIRVDKEDWYKFTSNDILLSDQLLRVFTTSISNLHLWNKHTK
jgi:hypothetical protein